MKKAIGIDLGGTNIKYGILTSKGDTIRLKYRDTEADKGAQKVVDNIMAVIEELVESADGKESLGIGIGAAGQVDAKTGIVYDPPNIPGWHAEKLKEKIEKKFNLPTFVDNDANVGALAESVFGAGKDSKYFVLITLGTGVGSGLIFDNKIYHGTAGMAGEFGHVTIQYDGPRCNCGNKGCIERFVGAQWMVERALNYLSSYPESKLHQFVADNPKNQNKEVTPKILSDLADNGDELCKRVIEETGKFLGIALGSLVNLLNLDLILIGGGVSNAGPLLFNSIEDSINEYSLPAPRSLVRIRQAALGEKAGFIGAAQLVFENLAQRS